MGVSEAPPSHLKRSVEQAVAAGGVLFRALGQKVGLFGDEEASAQALSETLGRLKGPVMKIGQILSTVPDMVPPAYAQAFAMLQSQAPSMGWLFVRRRMRAELGPDWESFFAFFSKEAAFAASLGQVHQARLLDGQEVACKLQYPQMEEILEGDLRHLSSLCKLYEKVGGGLETQNLQAELKDRLYEELDYTQEATHVQWFGSVLKGEEGIRLPVVHAKLSTKRLLTLSWLQGHPFQWVETQPERVREEAARRLFRAWYHPLYTAGLLHGDPHLGNYTFTEGEALTVNLFDFGCVRRFDPATVAAIVSLYQSLLKGCRSQERQAFRALGFESQDPDVLEALHLWARFLYGPLLEDRIRPLEENFSGLQGKEIAAQVHRLLRKGGGVCPPRAFVFLDRAAVGMGSAMIRLRVSLNWHQMFEALLQNFSPEGLQTIQRQLPKPPTNVYE